MIAISTLAPEQVGVSADPGRAQTGDDIGPRPGGGLIELQTGMGAGLRSIWQTSSAGCRRLFGGHHRRDRRIVRTGAPAPYQ